MLSMGDESLLFEQDDEEQVGASFSVATCTTLADSPVMCALRCSLASPAFCERETGRAPSRQHSCIPWEVTVLP